MISDENFLYADIQSTTIASILQILKCIIYI